MFGEAEYKQAVRRPAPLKNWKTQLKIGSLVVREWPMCVCTSAWVSHWAGYCRFTKHTLYSGQTVNVINMLFCEQALRIGAVSLESQVMISCFGAGEEIEGDFGFIGSKSVHFHWAVNFSFFLVKKQTKSSVAGWTNRTTSISICNSIVFSIVSLWGHYVLWES